MFHSEYGQDEWLVRNCFRDVWGGVFVEAGALNGLLDSNTLYLEREHKWHGILIEANWTLLPELKRNRPRCAVVGCALSAEDGFADFEIVKGTFYGWSGITGYAEADHRRRDEEKHTARVRTRTLASVLRDLAIHRVDYLSLDVEGAEFDVLSVYPFDEINIGIIGVEDNTGTNEPLRSLLTERGYVHMARVGVDDFWRRDH